jgi:hypothetical protein
MRLAGGMGKAVITPASKYFFSNLKNVNLPE